MTVIRQVFALFVLTRICASLALILLSGVSSMVQLAAFAIALIGLVPVAFVIGGMSRADGAGSAARRGPDGRNAQPVTAR